MKIWLDAQLPPSLAPWLQTTFGVDAVALRDLALRDADDQAIFDAARSADAAVMSKDQDFVELIQRLGPPPQLLWLTCGNVSNRNLERILTSALPKALEMLGNGEPIVEIADLPRAP